MPGNRAMHRQQPAVIPEISNSKRGRTKCRPIREVAEKKGWRWKRTKHKQRACPQPEVKKAKLAD